MLAGAPASADGLKQATLDAFTANLKGNAAPAWSDSLAASLKKLLGAERTAGSVLPLVARWDQDGKLSNDVKPAVAKAIAALADKSINDDARGQVAANLVGVRKLDASIAPPSPPCSAAMPASRCKSASWMPSATRPTPPVRSWRPLASLPLT